MLSNVLFCVYSAYKSLNEKVYYWLNQCNNIWLHIFTWNDWISTSDNNVFESVCYCNNIKQIHNNCYVAHLQCGDMFTTWLEKPCERVL